MHIGTFTAHHNSPPQRDDTLAHTVVSGLIMAFALAVAILFLGTL